MEKCFKMKEILDFNVPWNFQSIWTYFGNNIRKFKIKIHSFVFTTMCLLQSWNLNPLSANHTKWPNTLKQFVGNFPTKCWSVFDHFGGLALKGLKNSYLFTESPKPCMKNPKRTKKFVDKFFTSMRNKKMWTRLLFKQTHTMPRQSRNSRMVLEQYFQFHGNSK